mmetsp:Transcript_36756/g.96668  ORF Transcript_36756/g.96668 Transcript_36756/m.96668 type:complete len:405 (-) Transcript_36756:108-1322(-)
MQLREHCRRIDAAWHARHQDVNGLLNGAGGAPQHEDREEERADRVGAVPIRNAVGIEPAIVERPDESCRHADAEALQDVAKHVRQRGTHGKALLIVVPMVTVVVVVIMAVVMAVVVAVVIVAIVVVVVAVAVVVGRLLVPVIVAVPMRALLLARLVRGLDVLYHLVVLLLLVERRDPAVLRRAEHQLQLHPTALGRVHRRERRELRDGFLEEVELLRRRHEVGLVDDEDVGDLDLLAHQVDHLPVAVRELVRAEVLPLVDLVALLELGEERRTVDDGDERVQHRAAEHLRRRLVAVAEVVADLLRLRHARRLDHDVVPRHAALRRDVHHLLDRLQQLLRRAAARAAVLELDRVLCGGVAAAPHGDERRVDVDLCHIVDHDAHLQARLVLQQVLQHRRLTGAQEA